MRQQCTHSSVLLGPCNPGAPTPGLPTSCSSTRLHSRKRDCLASDGQPTRHQEGLSAYRCLRSVATLRGAQCAPRPSHGSTRPYHSGGEPPRRPFRGPIEALPSPTASGYPGLAGSPRAEAEAKRPQPQSSPVSPRASTGRSPLTRWRVDRCWAPRPAGLGLGGGGQGPRCRSPGER
jgi:hypothetical protein